MQLHAQVTLSEERVTILRCLGAFSDEALLQRTLDFAMSDKVRSQDTIYCVSSVAGNSAGRPVAWQWMRDNWQTIFTKYGGGQFMLSNFLKSVCQGYALSLPAFCLRLAPHSCHSLATSQLRVSAAPGRDLLFLRG
jgi:puromycin-sensitive aminopeptidase